MLRESPPHLSFSPSPSRLANQFSLCSRRLETRRILRRWREFAIITSRIIVARRVDYIISPGVLILIWETSSANDMIDRLRNNPSIFCAKIFFKSSTSQRKFVGSNVDDCCLHALPLLDVTGIAPLYTSNLDYEDSCQDSRV